MSTYIKHFFMHSCPLPGWARRFGLFGFIFFLSKGLLWLTVPALLFSWSQ